MEIFGQWALRPASSEAPKAQQSMDGRQEISSVAELTPLTCTEAGSQRPPVGRMVRVQGLGLRLETIGFWGSYCSLHKQKTSIDIQKTPDTK